MFLDIFTAKCIQSAIIRLNKRPKQPQGFITHTFSSIGKNSTASET